MNLLDLYYLADLFSIFLLIPDTYLLNSTYASTGSCHFTLTCSLLCKSIKIFFVYCICTLSNLYILYNIIKLYNLHFSTSLESFWCQFPVVILHNRCRSVSVWIASELHYVLLRMQCGCFLLFCTVRSGDDPAGVDQRASAGLPLLERLYLDMVLPLLVTGPTPNSPLLNGPWCSTWQMEEEQTLCELITRCTRRVQARKRDQSFTCSNFHLLTNEHQDEDKAKLHHGPSDLDHFRWLTVWCFTFL